VDERQRATVRAIDERVGLLRDQLRARYGWTHVEVTVRFVGGMLRVTGTIAVPRLRAAIHELLIDCVGPNFELELGPMPTLDWYRIADAGIELWAEHPSRAKRSLATELLASDGPIGLLAEAPPGLLMRSRDGTVGWLLGELGPREPARMLSAPTLPEEPGAAVCAAAKRYLGVPYVLGGTRDEHIDCSGLVARAYATTFGVILPRNSNDQLAVSGRSEALERAEGRAGDLLFMRSLTLGRTHVGIATGRGTVIHASRSRNSVLEEPLAEFETDAEWLRRVRWEAIVAWSRTQIGRAHVRLPTRARPI
jgi:hypothetical protein